MVIIKCSFSAGNVVLQMTEGNPGNGLYQGPCALSSRRSVPPHFRSSLLAYCNAERPFQRPPCSAKLDPIRTQSTMGASAATAQYRNNTQKPSPAQAAYFHSAFAQTLPKAGTRVQAPPNQRSRTNPGQVFRVLLRSPECPKLMSTKTQPNNHLSESHIRLENQIPPSDHATSTCVSPHSIQLSVSISHNDRQDSDVLSPSHGWNTKGGTSCHSISSLSHHPHDSSPCDEPDFRYHTMRRFPQQYSDPRINNTPKKTTTRQFQCYSPRLSSPSNDSISSGTDSELQSLSSYSSQTNAKNHESPYFMGTGASSDTESIVFERVRYEDDNDDEDCSDQYVSNPSCRRPNRQNVKNKNLTKWSNIRADSLTCCDTTSNLEFKKKWQLQRRSLDNQLFTRNVSEDMYPFITKDTVFEVSLQKDSRGLGLSICGGWNPNSSHPNAHLIRIKRLFPLQTAMNCGKLKVGDIILSVNGRKLTGLTYTEAIEILRMAPTDVVLIVCRPQEGILPSLPENPKFFFSQESLKPPIPQYMELDVALTKIGGTLGFTIVKNEDLNPGHYIKSLVKEPALSNGNLQPGDKIVLVNGTDISDMTHEEAIDFLRSLPDEVSLCLWRNVAPASSPLSPLSPGSSTSFFNDSVKAKKPKPLLRKEALDMLSDKARLKNEKKINAVLHAPSPTAIVNASPEAANENFLRMTPKRNSCGSAALSRDVSNTTDIVLHSPTSSGVTSLFSMQTTNRDSFSETESSGLGIEKLSTEPKPNAEEALSEEASNPNPKLQRPSFLDLESESKSPRKQMYGMRFANDANENQSTCDISDISYKCLESTESAQYSDEAPTTMTSSESSPIHMPNQSALLKWRGTTLTADETRSSPTESVRCQKPSVFKVELERKWNSRLGFSLVELTNTKSPGIYIKIIYPGSLAAMDGRLQVGDKLIEVNDNPVDSTSVDEVIDMLRKTQGKIILLVERLPDNFLPELARSPTGNVMHRSQSEQDNFSDISNMNVRNNNVTRQFQHSTTPLTEQFFNKNHATYSSLQMYS